MPLPDRFLSSLLLRASGKMILIDCGEGTQLPVKTAGWGFVSIEAILLTHCHADHIAGLPGLLLAMGNSGRTAPVSIYGPPGAAEAVKGLTVIAKALPFELCVKELPDNCQSGMTIGELTVSSLPVEHTLPCLAYSVELKRSGKFDTEKAEKNGVPKRFWSLLQKGLTVCGDGIMYEPSMVTGRARKGLKLVYCTDTRPSKSLEAFVSNADLLVCEGMYGSDDFKEKAISKKHMLFSEAAELAQKSGCRELWLTHYSPQLKTPEAFLERAKEIFVNTRLGHDLMKATLRFENDPE
ncbi:MAG: Ribonuclease Z [Firmicutes bacterium ADurb.Bin182]|nr:MAG: Ribonuclease Z [Firmicutes bacterium ADurb.Bin182]